MGPVTCCWYFYWDSMAGKVDKLSHGNEDFLPWFLHRMADYEQENGQRLLDVLDVHYYPEGVYNDDTSPSLAAQRLRATRSLWDRKYKDESWIEEPVFLIPRLIELIADTYPGTKLAITEWNFGAEETMNGALAIAEVLGIFGREQLDVATYYRYPEPNSPGYFAFKIYTNYDGMGGHFGDVSVQATTSDPDNVSAFGAKDSVTGRATLLLINKNPDRGYKVEVSVEGMTSVGNGSLYRYDQNDLTGIRVEPVDPSAPLGLDLPPYSLTLLVLEPGN